MSSAVSQVRTTDEWNAAVNDNPVLVIDCFAPWCGPCRAIGPIFANLAPSYPNVKFVKVDMDDVEDEVRELLEVSAMPSFRVVAHRQLIKNNEYRQVGASKEALVGLIQRAGGLVHAPGSA